jgi:CRP-like cAMP-binding protein
MWPEVIDRLREQIHYRLDQLAGEADRLRKALAALDPRSSSAPTAREAPARAAPARRRATAAPSKPKARPVKSEPVRRTRQPAARSPRRTAPGATKASVLVALGSEAMTAGQVADKTGLARATVATTLSKLAQSGEVRKAERGYRLAPAGD